MRDKSARWGPDSTPLKNRSLVKILLLRKANQTQHRLHRHDRYLVPPRLFALEAHPGDGRFHPLRLVRDHVRYHHLQEQQHVLKRDNAFANKLRPTSTTQTLLVHASLLRALDMLTGDESENSAPQSKRRTNTDMINTNATHSASKKEPSVGDAPQRSRCRRGPAACRARRRSRAAAATAQ